MLIRINCHFLISFSMIPSFGFRFMCSVLFVSIVIWSHISFNIFISIKFISTSSFIFLHSWWVLYSLLFCPSHHNRGSLLCYFNLQVFVAISLILGDGIYNLIKIIAITIKEMYRSSTKHYNTAVVKEVAGEVFQIVLFYFIISQSFFIGSLYS